MAEIDKYYDEMKAVPPCMKGRECSGKCFYFQECWPEELEKDIDYNNNYDPEDDDLDF